MEASVDGEFVGYKISLFYQVWTSNNPKAALILLHSLGDHSGRYSHLIDHIVPEGYDIYAFDFRGHGRSEVRFSLLMSKK